MLYNHVLEMCQLAQLTLYGEENETEELESRENDWTKLSLLNYRNSDRPLENTTTSLWKLFPYSTTGAEDNHHRLQLFWPSMAHTYAEPLFQNNCTKPSVIDNTDETQNANIEETGSSVRRLIFLTPFTFTFRE